jgi:hypothetical protein
MTTSTTEHEHKTTARLVAIAILIGCLAALYFNWQPPTYGSGGSPFGIGWLLEAGFWVWGVIPTVVWAPIVGVLAAVSLYGMALPAKDADAERPATPR